MKSEARILDSTAGNRGMWKMRESDSVLWIDIEPELSTPPDILMDCTKTDFEDGRFHTIFFDPPHGYGRTKNTGIHQTPSQDLMVEKWGKRGAYYGLDKYATKASLLGFINRAQQELHRILCDDGILWMKWAENHAKFANLLPLFEGWKVIMKHEVAYRGQVKTRTWWVGLMKVQSSCQKVIE